MSAQFCGYNISLLWLISRSLAITFRRTSLCSVLLLIVSQRMRSPRQRTTSQSGRCKSCHCDVAIFVARSKSQMLQNITLLQAPNATYLRSFAVNDEPQPHEPIMSSRIIQYRCLIDLALRTFACFDLDLLKSTTVLALATILVQSIYRNERSLLLTYQTGVLFHVNTVISLCG